MALSLFVSELREWFSPEAATLCWSQTGLAQEPIAKWTKQTRAKENTITGLVDRLTHGRVSTLVCLDVTSLRVSLDSLVQIYERRQPGSIVAFVKKDLAEELRSLLISPAGVLTFL